MFTYVYGDLSYQTHLVQSQSIIIDHDQVTKSVFFNNCNWNGAHRVFIVTINSHDENLSQSWDERFHKSKDHVFRIITGSSI